MKLLLKRLLLAAILLGLLWALLRSMRLPPTESAPIAPLVVDRNIAVEQPRQTPVPREAPPAAQESENPKLAPQPEISAVASAERLTDADEIRAWARSDPARAITWLLHAPPGEKRDAVMEMVCTEVTQFDPAEAVALADRYCGGYIPLLENLVHQWAERDEAAATAYANAKPPGEVRNRLLSRVALVRAKTDPASAAKLVVEQIEPGDIQSEAIISVLHAWHQQDRAAALAWAQSFPPNALRDRALQELASALR